MTNDHPRRAENKAKLLSDSPGGGKSQISVTGGPGAGAGSSGGPGRTPSPSPAVRGAGPLPPPWPSGPSGEDPVSTQGLSKVISLAQGPSPSFICRVPLPREVSCSQFQGRGWAISGGPACSNKAPGYCVEALGGLTLSLQVSTICVAPAGPLCPLPGPLGPQRPLGGATQGSLRAGGSQRAGGLLTMSAHRN